MDGTEKTISLRKAFFETEIGYDEFKRIDKCLFFGTLNIYPMYIFLKNINKYAGKNVVNANLIIRQGGLFTFAVLLAFFCLLQVVNVSEFMYNNPDIYIFLVHLSIFLIMLSIGLGFFIRRNALKAFQNILYKNAIHIDFGQWSVFRGLGHTYKCIENAEISNMAIKKEPTAEITKRDDIIDKLERIHKMKEQGIISEEEFLQEKEKILTAK